MIIITNNPKINQIQNKQIIFKEESYINILEDARNLIHNNYELLSHPLYSSIKPNQTPYRTIILRQINNLDLSSLLLIEDAIQTANNFTNNSELPIWDEDILNDFQAIDFNIIQNTLDRILD